MGSYMKRIFLTLLITAHIFSCHGQANEQNQEEHDQDKEILQNWQQFLAAIEHRDIPKIKTLLSDKIRCYECLENTPSEQKEMEYLRDSIENWYDKIYNDLVYIPKDIFVNEELELLFTKEFITILKTRKTLFSRKGENGYVVLVTTVEPMAGHEGMQHSFHFKKTKSGYVFEEIGTIP